MDLKRKIFSGASWNVFSQLANQGISLVVTVTLARILSPDDFGLVALSAVFVGFVQLFEDLAMGAAIVQRKNIDDAYLSTSFWVSLIVGIFLSAVLVSISPLAADFYGNELLKYILMVLALNLVVSPFTTIHRSMLSKRLEFNKLAAISIATALLSGVVSIVLALSGLGVWSLVLGGLVSGLLVAPMVWFLYPWRPKFIFDKFCFRDLFGFSSYILSFNVFNYFARNFDNIIIGKYLGTSVLGVYSIAYNLMMKPIRQVSWSVGKVLFPAFSSINDDKPRVRSAYLKTTRTIALITFPMMFGLMVVSNDFVSIFLGDKWKGVVYPLQLLCIVGATQSIGTTVGVIFNSQGRSDLLLKTGVCAALGHVIAFVIGIQWGLVGLIKCYIISNAIFFFFNQYFSGRLISLSLVDFLKNLISPLICSLLMSFCVILFKTTVVDQFHFGVAVGFVGSIIAGIVSYVLFVYIFLDKSEIIEYRSTVFGK